MAITAAMIEQLRATLDVPTVEAKEALELSEGNLELAVDLLRKAGETGADWNSLNVSSDGLIGFAGDDKLRDPDGGDRFVFPPSESDGRVQFTVNITGEDQAADANNAPDDLGQSLDDDLVSAGSIQVPNVKALRVGMKLSQSAFANRFGLSLTALQNWEQRRRTPDKAARILIRLIAANPDLVAQIAAEEAS